MVANERHLLIEDLESLGIRTTEIDEFDNSELRELAETIKTAFLKEYQMQSIEICDCKA
jgi:hypothetical protein